MAAAPPTVPPCIIEAPGPVGVTFTSKIVLYFLLATFSKASCTLPATSVVSALKSPLKAVITFDKFSLVAVL